MRYVLQTNSLTKKYKNFQALNGLTMNVPEGSVYGFVGKNGAGKTTLIRLICGLQEPSSGDFTLYGIQSGSRDMSRARRRMGARGGDTGCLYGYDGGRESETAVSYSGAAVL